MSFSSDIKNELLKLDDKKACCKLALCCGMTLFSKLLTSEDAVQSSSSIGVIRRLGDGISSTVGIITQIDTVFRRNHTAYWLSIPNREERAALIRFFSSDENNIRIDHEILKSECCKKAFLRGVFLICGTVADPNKEYHLEFSVSDRELSSDLAGLLSSVEELDITPSVAHRKGSYAVYIKESEKIADFLVYIGAKSSSMDMMQVKMLKEVRNYVNRKNNFETANIEKTVSASVKQLNAIKKFVKEKGFEGYPDDLRETARLRYENPDMSLREMSEKLNMSRSGVNHRLMRILESDK